MRKLKIFYKSYKSCTLNSSRHGNMGTISLVHTHRRISYETRIAQIIKILVTISIIKWTTKYRCERPDVANSMTSYLCSKYSYLRRKSLTDLENRMH